MEGSYGVVTGAGVDPAPAASAATLMAVVRASMGRTLAPPNETAMKGRLGGLLLVLAGRNGPRSGRDLDHGLLGYRCGGGLEPRRAARWRNDSLLRRRPWLPHRLRRLLRLSRRCLERGVMAAG